MVEGVHATVTGILGQYGLSGNVLEDALGLPNLHSLHSPTPPNRPRSLPCT